jgi:hypothetical protein
MLVVVMAVMVAVAVVVMMVVVVAMVVVVVMVVVLVLVLVLARALLLAVVTWMLLGPALAVSLLIWAQRAFVLPSKQAPVKRAPESRATWRPHPGR